MPFATFSKEDIPAIARVFTPSGRRLPNADILHALIEGIPEVSAADFDGDGKVSYAELAIYRALRNGYSLMPTYFVGKNGSKRVVT